MVGIGILVISLAVSDDTNHPDLLLWINEGMMNKVGIDVHHLVMFK